MIYNKTDDLCIKASGYGQENYRWDSVSWRGSRIQTVVFFQICILFSMGEKLVMYFGTEFKNAVQIKNNW